MMPTNITEAPVWVRGAADFLVDNAIAVLVTVIGGLLVLAIAGSWVWLRKEAVERHRGRRSARLKSFRKQLSRVTLDQSSDQIERMFRDNATVTVDTVSLKESVVLGKGVLRNYDMEFAVLSFAVRNGTVQSFAVRTKVKGLKKFSISGTHKFTSLSIGDRFGRCPAEQIDFREVSAGNRRVWFYEARGHVAEADQNIWLYGWNIYGHDFEKTRPLMPVVVARWTSDRYRERKPYRLTDQEKAELEAYRNSLSINIVGTMTPSEFHTSGGLIGTYMPWADSVNGPAGENGKRRMRSASRI